MKRILVPVGCRSDEGLSAPVIKRLNKYFDVDILQLEPQNFRYSYSLADSFCKSGRYDLMFVTGDRVEMCAAAAAAFHAKVPIAHFYAGIVNDPITTFDDIDRHCITLWSDIQFCEDENAAEVVWDLKMATSLGHNAHVVGISHLDDPEVDESKVPGEPYDLVLVNSEPLSEKGTADFYIKKHTKVVQIGCNPDGTIEDMGFTYYPNLPHPQFLGLLKNCQRFITNSSAAIYEAPHFLTPEQIVMVGDRNKNRPRGPFQTGASDRITEILREYLK